jgi:hypothetical protein
VSAWEDDGGMAGEAMANEDDRYLRRIAEALEAGDRDEASSWVLRWLSATKGEACTST